MLFMPYWCLCRQICFSCQLMHQNDFEWFFFCMWRKKRFRVNFSNPILYIQNVSIASIYLSLQNWISLLPTLLELLTPRSKAGIKIATGPVDWGHWFQYWSIGLCDKQARRSHDFSLHRILHFREISFKGHIFPYNATREYAKIPEQKTW